MICHNCGSKIEYFTRFCSTCGAEQLTPKGGDTDPDGILRTTQMEKPEIRVPRWRLSKMEGYKIPDGFPLQARTRLGRDPRCEIVLPSPNISRYHAQIEWSDSGFQISDLGSTNGTYVNRKLIKEPTRIKIGATVQLGEYSFLVMKDSTICGNCGETVRSDDRYCQFCGNSLIGPELRPDRGTTGALLVEEPFPETTPVPVVGEITGGLHTPKYNTPPYIPGSERPRPQEKPAPPPTPPPVRRSAIAPPAPPAPLPTTIKPAGTPDTEKRSAPWRTCGILVLAGLCGLTALAATGYYLYSNGVFP
jgi:RNA polymerase subunit RPABC4/transcription elongation factor Spt4